MLSLTDATDGRFKALVWLMVKCRCLEVLGCCSSTTRYKSVDLRAFAVLREPLGSAEVFV